MANTPFANLFKWEITNTKQQTITEMALNADKIDTKLKENSDSIATHQGKIIEESGSNTNGNYIRFADGLQICSASRTGALVIGDNTFTVPLPASFVNNNYHVTSSMLYTSAVTDTWFIRAAASNLNSVDLRVKMNQASTGASISLFCIGRWK